MHQFTPLQLTAIYLQIARYVPNRVKTSIGHQCTKYEYWRPMDRQPTSHFWKIWTNRWKTQ